MSARVLRATILAFAVTLTASFGTPSWAPGWASSWNSMMSTGIAHAGTVQGTVKLKKSYGNPLVRSQGFVKRKSNPWLATRKFTPMPWIVVVLEGPADAKAPPRDAAQYPLDGQNFGRPILAVQIAREVVIKNLRKNAHRIFSPENPKLIEEGEIGPGGKRSFVLSKGFELVTLRAKDNPHLLGRLLPIPHAYFAQPSASGEFTISDVPAGKWRVKVWYRDGWLATKTLIIDVGRSGKKTKVQVPLPQSLSTKK